MRTLLKSVLVGLLLVCVAQIARADTLVLRDGTRVSGVLVGATAETLKFEDADGVLHQYKKSEVQTVEFGAGAQGAAKLETLPSGTEISVRTIQSIDSKSAREGQVFSAKVNQDVLGSSNNVMIPKGSQAELVIQKVASGGFLGTPELTLHVQAVTIDGQRYQVSTADLQKKTDTGMGINKETAGAIAGQALPGTIPGAPVPGTIVPGIPGVGPTAGAGAAASAAAGAGSQFLSTGKEVRVPADTVLKFQLDKPVSLPPTP